MFYEREDINENVISISNDIYTTRDFDKLHKESSGKPCNIFINCINGYDIKATRYYQYPADEIVERVDVYIKKKGTQGKPHEFGIIMFENNPEPVMKAIKEIVGQF